VDEPPIEGKEEQARELMKTFFPPLPEGIEDELVQGRRPAFHFPQLTMQEVETKI
jgi:hypothetical protein